MSIDLLPISAFALESCAAPAAATTEGQTLTLALRLARKPAAMSGSLAIQALQVAAPDATHFAIAKADASAVTITF
jgi:hypothetical protein